MAVALPPRFGLEVLIARTRAAPPGSGELDIASAAPLHSAVLELAGLDHAAVPS